MGLKEVLAEKLILPITKKLREEKGLIAPLSTVAWGESPAISFSTLLNNYLSDTEVAMGIDFLAEAIVGSGFYINSDDDKAKKIVEEFCAEVNLDNLNLMIAKEVIAFGNSFIEKIEPDDLINLKHIPISTIWKVKRDEYGKVERYEQLINGKIVELEPDRIIHFRFNAMNNSPFGYGLLHQLSTKKKYVVRLSDGNIKERTIPSLLELKWIMEDDMRKILHRYVPRHVYEFENASEDFITNQANVIKSLEPEQDFVFGGKGIKLNIHEVSIDPRARFEGFIEHFDNQRLIGLQTPIFKLFTTPGFTEASAKEATRMAERKVLSIQRFLKRIIEREIFRPLIEQAGLDWKLVNLRLNWGMPERPEVKLEDIQRFFDLKIISKEEARRILSKLGLELDKNEDFEERLS
ncbi:MAG: hypothetical protein QXD82_02660 [Nitrososphaerales archaeon]